jgi:carbon monoxide dehydrogenase subunit G
VKVEGERSFAATREVVWGVLNDPAQMAALMPGVQSFEVRDDTHWSASVEIPLGLGTLALSIDFEKAEEREPEFASLKAKGRGVGALLSMQTSFTLEPAEAGTRMLWAADVSVAGPVGSMGQRVLQPIVKQQVNQVLTALDRRVTEAQAGSTVA